MPGPEEASVGVPGITPLRGQGRSGRISARDGGINGDQLQHLLQHLRAVGLYGTAR